jgi:hypothetical protein
VQHRLFLPARFGFRLYRRTQQYAVDLNPNTRTWRQPMPLDHLSHLLIDRTLTRLVAWPRVRLPSCRTFYSNQTQSMRLTICLPSCIKMAMLSQKHAEAIVQKLVPDSDFPNLLLDIYNMSKSLEHQALLGIVVPSKSRWQGYYELTRLHKPIIGNMLMLWPCGRSFVTWRVRVSNSWKIYSLESDYGCL